MTDRLYYPDSYARRFTGRVLETAPSGKPPIAVLDQSLFYPTSGGQPHDTGRLGTARVVDVVVREADDAVLHVLDTPVDPGPIEGVIDWTRRFDHMQQHTGQHILSQALLHAAGAVTIGFHLGPETVSVDLGVANLPELRVAEAESLANQVVAAHVPVRAWFPTGSELAALALRKQPEVTGPIRVVAIGEFDRSACGGTHVATSGEVGLIAVQRAERLKRGIRVEFLCGERARADYARKHAIVRELSAALTCSPGELGESVNRLRDAFQDARRQLSVYRERELDEEAARRLAGSAQQGDLRVVRAAWDERPIEEVKGLALRLTSHPGVVVLLGIAGARAQVLFGRSDQLAVDLETVFRRTLEALGGGRGGGTRLLQGAAGPADLATVERVLQEAEARLGAAGS